MSFSIISCQIPQSQSRWWTHNTHSGILGNGCSWSPLFLCCVTGCDGRTEPDGTFQEVGPVQHAHHWAAGRNPTWQLSLCVTWDPVTLKIYFWTSLLLLWWAATAKPDSKWELDSMEWIQMTSFGTSAERMTVVVKHGINRLGDKKRDTRLALCWQKADSSVLTSGPSTCQRNLPWD